VELADFTAVLSGIQGIKCLVNLDYIVVFGKNFKHTLMGFMQFSVE
jgi:ABC-type microcin C transport system permease subunit YejB